MKCALIFVSLIALGCAVPLLQEASIRIAVADDGTISIYGTAENKLVISRVLEHPGPRNVEVFAGFEDRAVKRILLDQETTVDLANAQYWTGLTEADILVHIFKNYQGYVDVNTYTNLLRQIHTHVQSGHVSMAVYNILKSFVILEVSWEQHVTPNADMAYSVSPTWHRMLSRLGLEGTESRHTLFHEASIRIAVADDVTISINGATGNKLVISKVLGHLGQKNVEVLMGDEHGTLKRVLLDQETYVEHSDVHFQAGLTEADILVHIFKNYQGYVDVNTYTNLLRQIHTHVQSGHVSMAVYNILKSFIAREVSWERHVTPEADKAEYISPEWYSIFNRLGLKDTGSKFTHATPNHVPYDLEYFSAEPRNVVGQSEFERHVTPEEYYVRDLDTLIRQTIQPAQIQSTHQQQGYNMWQQPIYQRSPKQFDYYNNYVNAPFVY